MTRLPTASRPSLFDRAERLLRTDLHYVLTGGSWLFAGQVVGIIASFLLAIGYAHFLSQESYGTYKFVLSILGMLSLFTLPGMEAGAQKGSAVGKDGVFWDTLKYRFIGGVFAACTSGAIGLYYFLNSNMLLAGIFFSAAPFLVVMDPLSHYNGVLTGKKLFRKISTYGILLQIATSASILLVVILTGDLFFLMLAYLGSAVLFRMFFFWRTIVTVPMNSAKDPDSLAFGGHISVMAILGTISTKLDSLLLWHFLGPIHLAIYAFARGLTDNIQSSFKLVTGAIAFPKLAAQNKELVKDTLLRKIALAHLITIPLTLIVIFTIPIVFRFVFPTYMDSVIYAQALTLLLAFAPLRLVSTAIAALAPAKMIYQTSIASSILNAGFLLVFVPLFGIWGVILALAAQQTIVNALNIYLFKKM